jgi:shikimate dehydrogenase
VIRYLDNADDAARTIGAVNTIKISDEKLYGHNTDAAGFIDPLKRKFGDLASARVALAGAGGAARACAYSLNEARADVTLFARDTAKAESMAGDFKIDVKPLRLDTRDPSTFAGFDIVVNATPLGTKGSKQNYSIAYADQLKDVKLVYDLIYNPTETRLIHEARCAGADTLGGLDMLIAQGARQFEIWTGEEAPLAEMTAAVRKRLRL